MRAEEKDLTTLKEEHDRLMELAFSFLASQALYSAVRLDIFTHLSGKALTLSEMAGSLGISSQRLEKLLNTCISMGLLERQGERYRNSPLAEKCLVKGRPGYYGHMVHYVMFLFYEKGLKMEEAVREDQPIVDYEPMRRKDDEISRTSTLAMEDQSVKVGQMLAETLKIPEGGRLLDVGGGSGAVARVMAERVKGLEAVILDQPLVLQAAEELIAASPAGERIKTFAADYNVDDFPGGFDLILLSNIIHINGEKACQRLMEKAYRALRPRGQAVVIDFYLDDDKRGPLFANLFGLACSLLAPEGATYSRAEVEQWMKVAGFQEIRRANLTTHVGCVIGRRT